MNTPYPNNIKNSTDSLANQLNNLAINQTPKQRTGSIFNSNPPQNTPHGTTILQHLHEFNKKQ